MNFGYRHGSRQVSHFYASSLFDYGCGSWTLRVVSFRCDLFFGFEDLLEQDLKVLKDRKKELSQAGGIYRSNTCVRRWWAAGAEKEQS